MKKALDYPLAFGFPSLACFSTHPYSLSGLCPGWDPTHWDWLGPSGQPDQGSQDVEAARLKGQEGSLKRDNRWKGRRNWEPPGLGC